MSSPIECFTALLRGQNMFKIPLLPRAWRVALVPEPKIVVPMLNFEYTCEKQLPRETSDPRLRSHQLQHRYLNSSELPHKHATNQKICQTHTILPHTSTATLVLSETMICHSDAAVNVNYLIKSPQGLQHQEISLRLADI